MDRVEVVNNKKEFRFEINFPDGEPAILTYRWLRGSMVLMHTFVPPSHRNQGVAAMLVKYVLDYIREQHLKMIVYCPYVTEYLKKHPEYNDLLDEKHSNTKS